MHIEEEYSYHLRSVVRDEVFNKIKILYVKLTGNQLPIYGIPGPLENYAT